MNTQDIYEPRVCGNYKALRWAKVDDGDLYPPETAWNYEGTPNDKISDLDERVALLERAIGGLTDG